MASQTRSRWIWGLAIVVGLGAALFMHLVVLRKVTTDNFDRIQAGMPYAEVVRILGPPDGAAPSRMTGATAYYWSGWDEEGTFHITVHFDTAGNVVSKGLLGGKPTGDGW